MENQKRYIEIRIEMDGDGTCVELHAKRVSAKDLAEGYVTVAETIAEAIAQRSNATASEALGQWRWTFLRSGQKHMKTKRRTNMLPTTPIQDLLSVGIVLIACILDLMWMSDRKKKRGNKNE